jgi:hypothetical protein
MGGRKADEIVGNGDSERKSVGSKYEARWKLWRHGS